MLLTTASLLLGQQAQPFPARVGARRVDVAVVGGGALGCGAALALAEAGHQVGLWERGTLGSAGFGLRMPVAEPLILRLDFGYRFHSGDLLSYGLPPSSRGRKFVDFFFGFNY